MLFFFSCVKIYNIGVGYEKKESTLLDTNGNSYTFEYATSKDQFGTLKNISEGASIIIPEGFKTTLYAVLTIYLKN